jgi:TrpR-related protein YerC/YecD
MEQTLQKNRSLWLLFEAITLLDNKEDCALFFRDLCTVGELEAMAERWEVAQLIDQGIPYRKIRELTGASTTTISRIAHWLRHGEGGYSKLLAKLRAKNPD